LTNAALFRLSTLLEQEEKQHEKDAGNERAKQFKDSMVRKYSAASDEMTSVDGEYNVSLGGSEGSLALDLTEGTSTPDTLSRTSSVGSFEEGEGCVVIVHIQLMTLTAHHVPLFY
jgi:hypothetical protein